MIQSTPSSVINIVSLHNGCHNRIDVSLAVISWSASGAANATGSAQKATALMWPGSVSGPCFPKSTAFTGAAMEVNVRIYAYHIN